MTFDEYKKQAFQKDPELKKEYDRLEPEYAIIRQLIEVRTQQHLSQKDLAERIGTRQTNISRLESGNYNPSLQFLKKVAEGLGKELYIEFR